MSTECTDTQYELISSGHYFLEDKLSEPRFIGLTLMSDGNNAGKVLTPHHFSFVQYKFASGIPFGFIVSEWALKLYQQNLPEYLLPSLNKPLPKSVYVSYCGRQSIKELGYIKIHYSGFQALVMKYETPWTVLGGHDSFSLNKLIIANLSLLHCLETISPFATTRQFPAKISFCSLRFLPCRKVNPQLPPIAGKMPRPIAANAML